MEEYLIDSPIEYIQSVELTIRSYEYEGYEIIFKNEVNVK